MTRIIHMDMLTPKQARLMSYIYRELQDDYNFILTSRANAETENVLYHEKIHQLVRLIGSHGKDTAEKARKRFHRQSELAYLYDRHQIDLLIAHGSPSATQVAFAYGVPIIQMTDTAHAGPTNLLTLPFSTHFICSAAFKKDNPFQPYLSPETRIHYFDGVDEAVWVQDWQTQFNPIPQKIPVIYVRAPEMRAVYANVLYPTVEKILHSLDKLQHPLDVRILTRYLDQDPTFPSSQNLTVSTVSYSTPLEIYEKASGFIGIGGTMNREAAMLGVPSLTLVYFDYVNHYIANRGFPLYYGGINEIDKTIRLFMENVIYPSTVQYSPLVTQLEHSVTVVKLLVKSMILGC